MYLNSMGAMNPTSVFRCFKVRFVVAGFELVSGQAADGIPGESLQIMVAESAVEAYRERLRR